MITNSYKYIHSRPPVDDEGEEDDCDEFIELRPAPLQQQHFASEVVVDDNYDIENDELIN